MKKKRLRYLGILPFVLLLLLIIAMAWGTFSEKERGTEYAYTHFYGTWWFVLLWALLALGSLVPLIVRKVYKKFPLLLLHLSFILILVGALVTHIFSQTGYLVLQKNIPTSSYQEEKQGIQYFPFQLKLNSFQIDHYPGTQSPANYISRMEIYDTEKNDNFSAEISMNNILKYRGYRFYQSSFDDDLQSSTLTVSKDVWGIPITYAGYFLLFASMLWLLFDPKGTFRRLLRHPALKKNALLLALLLGGFALSANETETLSKEKITLSRSQAKEFEKIRMLYNGRIVPLSTFAEEFTMKLTGERSYKYANSIQVLSGWIFFPQVWKTIAFFEVKHPQLKSILSLKNSHASFNDLYDNEQNYKLAPFYKEMYKQGKQSPFLKEALKLDEKIQLVNMLQSGNILTVFPCQYNNHVYWVSPIDSLSPTLSAENNSFYRSFFPHYYKALLDNDTKEANRLLRQLEVFQCKNATNTLPSNTLRRMEISYNKLHIFSWLFMLNLTLGVLAFATFMVQTVRNKNNAAISKTIVAALLLAFVVLTIIIGMRSFIAQRFPISNGFETMIFIAWCALLVSLLLRKYTDLIPTFGLLISGFALLVAHLGDMNPQITPLVPVLSSPLLSIHVSLIMVSYALIAFLTLNSLTYFSMLLFAKKENPHIYLMLNKLNILNKLILYPCCFLLAAGIFVGAIWANISWGRYWGWDPKEVWSLITLLLISGAFHTKTIKIFSNKFFLNVYILLIFASTLMTYFGVNYFLGGLHSYAGTAGGSIPKILWIGGGIITGLCILIGIAYQKTKLQSK